MLGAARPLVAAADRVALLDVVGLVEDQLVRLAQVPEPQEAADRGDEQRAEPAPQRGRRPRAEQPAAQAGGQPPLGLGRVRRRRRSRARAVAVTARSWRPPSGSSARTASDDGQRRCCCSWPRRRSATSPTPPPRLARALAGADVVAAEDTRRLRRLTAALGITPRGRVVSYHEHNEAARTPELLEAAGRRRHRRGGHRRGHAVGVRPGLPAGRRRGRGRRAGQRGAGAERGADGARACPGCRSTGSASRGSCRARPASGPGPWPPWPTSAARWSSSRPRTGSPSTLEAMAEAFGPSGRPRCAAS